MDILSQLLRIYLIISSCLNSTWVNPHIQVQAISLIRAQTTFSLQSSAARSIL